MHKPGFSTPDNLKHLSVSQSGRHWLATLPGLISSAISHWALEDVGVPYAGSSVSYTVPAVCRVSGQRTDVVLKIQFPHEECRQEADALRQWNGNGAVRLIDHEPGNHMLLLERCRPGELLADVKNADPISVLSDLLPRLWQPTSFPFKTLTDEALEWETHLTKASAFPDDAREERLLRLALDQLAHLTETSPEEEVLLHQDLHGHNILSNGEVGWLAIDPKPLIGERAFSLAPIVRSFEFGFSKRETLYRLDRLSEALALDRERARGWTIVQTIAWGLDSTWKARHQQTVEWLLPD